ncbi:GntR family transcriptional regulator [Arachidicoccus sp.]|uniref:GntR family transcriptional regulator n=1 Tax=Arachidicoccus sp. TaxID=1872624 RepID=UPI003D23AABC
MQFDNSPQAIYLQIVDYVCEKLLLKQWTIEDKIPSVREMAVKMEVNPNTVARAYDFLKQQSIIYDKRGIGYFISPEGLNNTISYRKQEFAEKELPGIFRTMYLLDVELDDLKTEFEKFKELYAKNQKLF